MVVEYSTDLLLLINTYTKGVAPLKISGRTLACVRKVSVRLDLWGAAKSAAYRDRPRMLNLLVPEFGI
jgi:hypothetical protein